MASTTRRRLRRDEYTIGWVCALPIELAAAQEMLDEEHDDLDQNPNDSNLYTFGNIGKHNVVIACLPAGQTGTNSAAAVAVQMMSSFSKIRFGLMVGIGGGVPSAQADIRLGDVVISQPAQWHGGVVQYDFGKTTPDGFERTGFLHAPPLILLQAVAKLRANHFRGRSNLSDYLTTLNKQPAFARDKTGPDILFQATYNHVGGPTCGLCSKDMEVERPGRESSQVTVHYGTIASGNQVMRDGSTRDRVSTAFGGVLCFEMEAAGLMNSFPCLVIRGICDYADSHKNKGWQAYAAGTAAACAKEVLTIIPAAEVLVAPTVDETTDGKNASHKSCWSVPFKRNPRFVGRASELATIEAKISQTNCDRVAIIGLGGVGKTQIALEFAYRLRERCADCSVFWAPATNIESMQEAYLEIGRQLQIPRVDEERANIQRLVLDRLGEESAGRWLLVFDNADNLDLWVDEGGSAAHPHRLIDMLPKSGHGSILFTTRDRKTAVKLAGNNVVRVAEMDEIIAKQLLANSLIDKNLMEDERATTDLLDWLTFLPLAIVQAASYINENDISLLEYLDLLQDTEQNRIDILSEDFEDLGRYRNTKNPVASTWLISFEQIRRRNPLAAEYLSFMSCLDPKEVPRSLLPPAESKKMEVDAIGTLKAYSFVTNRSTNQSLDLHRLVHLATRNWLRTEKSLAHWSCKAIARLEEIFPDNDHKNRSLWTAYLAHARYVLESDLADSGKEKTALEWKFGMCLYSDGRYDEAEKSFVQVMETWKRALGEEHPDTLTSMTYLASTYSNQGRWTEAEELGLRVLETRKRVLGEEHPGTLSSMANLASTYMGQGRWTEAEELQTEGLKICAWVLGEEHPSMLTSMANLASTYYNQGRWTEAEELEVRVLETKKRVLGEEHPDTLISMANLASTYWNQGRWTEAEELEVRVMETEKRVLGEEHPSTLTSMNNLASTYRNQGRWTEAEELGVRVLETRKRVLGEEHPSTLTSMANLALTYYKQGRWTEAEKLGVRVMETRKKVLGEEHPDTLTSMANLASTYRDQGRWTEAEKLEVRVMETRKRVLGEEHPDTLNSMNNLAFTWKVQGRNKQAIDLMSKCVQLRQQKLGADHPDTKFSLQTLKDWQAIV